MEGDFRWLMRARVSVNFDGQHPQLEPVELHDQFLYNLEHRYYEHVEENRTAKIATVKKTSETGSLVKYPNSALNEIFIGESLSAR